MITRVTFASHASAPRGFGGDRTCVLELTGRTAFERPQIDVDDDVRSLAGNARPIGRGEPLPADLAQRVGPALPGRSPVGFVRSGLDVDDRAKRRDQ